MNQYPHREDMIGIALVLTWEAFWLGGSVWLGRRASGSWGAAFFSAWPVALAVYVYRSARGAFLPRRPRFPALWSFSGISAVAIIFMSAGSLTGTPAATSTPSNGAFESDGSAPVSGIHHDGQGTPATGRTEASPGDVSDAETSYSPVAIRDELLDEPVLVPENAGETEPDVWSDEDDDLEWGWWVYQSSEMGETTFALYETDKAARESFGYYADGDSYRVPGMPRHKAVSYTDDDGYLTVVVAVGNALLFADTHDDILADAGYGSDVTVNTAVDRLAAGAVRRVIRLGGEPNRNQADFL